MKFSAFRIRNFRSIVDTGWQNISPDNITCLIGQNESGKTSILEGLKVFYTGIISEDVLRSDLTLPEISCRFRIPQGWLLKITDNPGPELKELLSGLTCVELTRSWLQDLSSVVNVSGEISKYLNSLEDAWRLYLSDVTSKLKEEMNSIHNLESTYSELSKEESELKSNISQFDSKLLSFRLFRRKSSDSITPADDHQLKRIKSRLNDLKKKKAEISELLTRKQSVKNAGEKWEKQQERFNELDNQLNILSGKLEERHQKMTLLLRSVVDDSDIEWKEVLNDYRTKRSEREARIAEIENHIAYAGYIINGCTESEAETKVNEIIHSYKSHYNSEILGKKYFEYSPVFELFEDFGSLLPNRIDMDDIIAGNENVEGYKAARNFLTLAKLDYSFFQQPSSRILKQKIENLNHSLTHNFHDFWQQSIGRNNKIRIQFELDHYSASFGAKAGKPYLEFWIKDEGERLYPKQRSRGVRWFLSFYMELKAAASLIDKNIVLLVDEPGISLHARAQEDVLKVFEDIKDKMQVIYTTHSPHLVEINKLHRVLAVQRDDLDSVRSTTMILDPLRLANASPDTLTPLQSIMGNPMGGESFSSKGINIIVNDIGSFYILKSIMLLMAYNGKVSLLPSTKVSSIPLLCNILMGWGMDFAVMIFANDEEEYIAELLKNTIFSTDNGGNEMIIRMPEKFLNSEDLLSTLDFKNNILNSREGITVSNSQYLSEKELPRNFILSRFLSGVKEGRISVNNFDEESLENFKLVIELVNGLHQRMK